jgi:hypothetical protein
MKNDLERTVRMLEEATAVGDVPAERLDAETASLREAWLAFGEMLEAAQPPGVSENDCRAETARYFSAAAFEGATRRAGARRRHLLMVGLLAASLLVAVATAWMLSGETPQDNPTDGPKQMATADPKAAPSQKGRVKSVSTADALRWDDSLDEQFEQVGWQMLCVQENQAFRTDAFEHAQYRLEQLRETIQADSL